MGDDALDGLGISPGCLCSAVFGRTDTYIAFGLHSEDLAAHLSLETHALLDDAAADRHAFTCDGPL